MPAHHALNGVPCHANSWLLDTVLRKEWGFDGFVTSDMGDISKLGTGGGYGGYRFVRDDFESAVASRLGRFYFTASWAINPGTTSGKLFLPRFPALTSFGENGGCWPKTIRFVQRSIWMCVSTICPGWVRLSIVIGSFDQVTLAGSILELGGRKPVPLAECRGEVLA